MKLKKGIQDQLQKEKDRFYKTSTLHLLFNFIMPSKLPKNYILLWTS